MLRYSLLLSILLLATSSFATQRVTLEALPDELLLKIGNHILTKGPTLAEMRKGEDQNALMRFTSVNRNLYRLRRDLISQTQVIIPLYNKQAEPTSFAWLWNLCTYIFNIRTFDPQALDEAFRTNGSFSKLYGFRLNLGQTTPEFVSQLPQGVKFLSIIETDPDREIGPISLHALLRFTQVEQLEIVGFPDSIYDIAAIGRLKTLKTLAIGLGSIETDLSALSDLAELELLKVDATIHSINGIQELGKLKSLVINGSVLALDQNFFSQLPSGLKELTLLFPKITDVALFRGLSHLHKITFTFTEEGSEEEIESIKRELPNVEITVETDPLLR